MIVQPPLQAPFRMDKLGKIISPEWIAWLHTVCSSVTPTGELATGYNNPNPTLDHTKLLNVQQSDDTSSSTATGKHVTNAQVKKYEDHRLITDANPHGTNWDQIEQTSSKIPFNTSSSNPAHAEGMLFYDHEDHSLAYYNEASGVTANICREMLVRVYNNSGSYLSDGQIVYVNGANSSWPTVTLAKADTSVDSQSVLGMVTNPISNGYYGYVCVSGVVHGLNTISYPAGTTVFLSPTTYGAFTSTEPIQPYYTVEIGTILYQHSSEGKIFVHTDKKAWFPNLQVLDTTSSVTLPNTPTIYKAPTTVRSEGFSYDSSSGEIAINVSSDYSVTILLNAQPSASNKNIYFYVEEYYNGTWSIGQYTARQLSLPNTVQTQLTISASRYWTKGSKLRFYIWGDNTVYLKTTDLPGTSPGTVTIPAYRLLMA